MAMSGGLCFGRIVLDWIFERDGKKDFSFSVSRSCGQLSFFEIANFGDRENVSLVVSHEGDESKEVHSHADFVRMAMKNMCTASGQEEVEKILSEELFQAIDTSGTPQSLADLVYIFDQQKQETVHF